MRLLVVQHEDDCPPGWFGDWFTAAGLRVEVVRPYAGDHLPPRLDGLAGLVVLGGGMSAYDEAAYPWLGPVKALLRTAVAEGLPTLGICLGHQLLTAACGGRVEPHPDGRRVGVVAPELSAAGADDPVLGAVRPAVRAVRWNQDVVTRLPTGARLLAVDAEGVPQAIRVGPRAWGVQFHPEASPALVRSWAARTLTGPGGDGRPTPEDVAGAVRAVESAEDELRHASAAFAAAFAAHVHAYA